MITGSVKNWSEFQHYKDRAPPWLKLHRGLLDDFDYARLPLASKALAPLLWLLASENIDGTVNVESEWLAFRLRWPVADIELGLSPLIQSGFIIVASGVLAECLQRATPEVEAEIETETDLLTPNGVRVETPVSTSADVPVKKIVELYHEKLPELPRVEKITKTRAGLIRQRWKEDLPTLESWANYFADVRGSPFLMGRVAPTNGRPPFVADLEFLVRPSSFAKIAEGKYHR